MQFTAMDHSTLSVKMHRKHIPANQQLYINKAKSGKKLFFHLFTSFLTDNFQAVVAVLCDMHSLMPVGFFMFLSMNGFLPGCLFAVVVI